MDLDEYKILTEKTQTFYGLKQVPELTEQVTGSTRTVLETIKKNLKLELAFALLFFVIACCMVFVFTDVLYMRFFIILLAVFCLVVIYYLVKLIRYIQVEFSWDAPVKLQLEQYIRILSRFTKLYYQITMVMVPLIFITGFMAAYLDQSGFGEINIQISSVALGFYIGIAIGWSVLMYFVTRWYIRSLYGNYLNQLKQQYHELNIAE